MKKGFTFFLSTIVLFLFVSDGISKEVTKTNGLKISSPVFENNGYMPEKYTCDGKNSNPPLVIENVPSKAKSLALIVDDPDAPRGTWVHWVLWNITPETKEIKENAVTTGATQGLNDFRIHDYRGPCPPSGTHRYFFKMYALDTILNLNSSATKTDMEKAMQGHILEQAQIIGLYKRR